MLFLLFFSSVYCASDDSSGGARTPPLSSIRSVENSPVSSVQDSPSQHSALRDLFDNPPVFRLTLAEQDPDQLRPRVERVNRAVLRARRLAFSGLSPEV